jgi:hypothetical protein
MFFSCQQDTSTRVQSRVPVCFADWPLGRGLEGECAGDAHFSFQAGQGLRVRAKQVPDLETQNWKIKL